MADLRSRAVIRVLDLISEGPIEGFPEGDAEKEKYIFLNDTPLKNADGTRNFHGYDDAGAVDYSTLKVDARYGTVNQAYIEGQNGAETTTAVGQNVTFSTPVIRSVTTSNISQIRVILSWPALYYQGKNLDGWDVQIRISLRINAGAWTTMITDTVSGRTMSPYQKEYAIPITVATSSTTYDVRVERLTVDDVDAMHKSVFAFASFTTVVDSKLRYPFSAMVGLAFDASTFSSPPKRSYDLKLRKVRVPSNYTRPATWVAGSSQVYTGAWNGTFKAQEEWTDDPAWIFYDLATNKRYGLGRYIDEALIDKWTLYEISRYCAAVDTNGVYQGVDDGFGNKEPRFTCNLLLASAEEAYKVLNAMASIFRAFIYWGAGSIILSQDSPTLASERYLFTTANVIGGNFSYEGTARSARHTVALVRWNDPLDKYRPKVEYVELADQIARYGVRPIELTAVGCTKRSEANRLGRWALYSDTSETEVVSFSTGLEGSLCYPGQVIDIQDSKRTGERFSGRVVSATSTSITIDSPITITAGTHTLELIVPNGNDIQMVTKTLTNGAGSTSTLTWSGALTEVPVAGAMWVVASPSLVPTTWRILTINEAEPNIYQILAVSHNPDKFAAVENGLKLQPRPVIRPSDYVPSPTNVLVSEAASETAAGKYVDLTVSWQAPRAGLKYRVEYKFGSADWVRLPETVSLSAVISDIGIGTYLVRVYAIDERGRESFPAYGSPFVSGTGGSNTALGTVQNLRVLGRTAGAGDQYQFSGRDIRLTWDAPNVTQANLSNIRGYQVVLKNGPTIIYTEEVVTAPFAFTYEQNIQYGGPFRTLNVEVRAVDLRGKLGNAATCTVTNPAPGAVSALSVVSAFDLAVVKFTPPAESDVTGFVIHMANASGFVVGPGNLVYDGPDTYVNLRMPVKTDTYYIKVAAYDAFGKTGLTYSTEVSTTPQRVDHADLALSFEAELANYNAQYTIKLANGVIAGYGLASTSSTATPTAAFVIQADKFGMVKPGSGVAAITSLSRTGTTVTVTTGAAHGFAAGSSVGIARTRNSAFPGNCVILAVPTPATFTYTTVASGTLSGTGGTATVGAIIPFIFDSTVNPPVLSVQGYISADRIRAGTFQVVNYLGSTKVILDGTQERLSVFDGVRDRVQLGKLPGGGYGINIYKSDGNILLSADGTLGDTVVFGGSGLTTSQVAQGATSYWMTSSIGAIQENNNVRTPAAVTFNAMSQNGASAPAAYLGRFIIATSADGTTYTDVYSSVSNESSATYTPGNDLKFIRCRLYKSGGVTDLVDELSVPIIKSGQAVQGADAIYVLLSNEVHILPADNNGEVAPGDYVGSGTEIRVFEGGTELGYVNTPPGPGQFTVGTPVVAPVGALTVGGITYTGGGTLPAPLTVTSSDGKVTVDSATQNAALDAAVATTTGSKTLAYSTYWKNALGSNAVMYLLRNGVEMWRGIVNGSLTMVDVNIRIPASYTQISLSPADIDTGECSFTIHNASNSDVFQRVRASSPSGDGLVKLSADTYTGGTITIQEVYIVPPLLD
ncbi:MAG: DUF1983 domain-containing protein [Desulfurellales bacterium]|nr:MAG: DUF1983 domain-containing protein [Desulfurellales bacterium]